MGEGLRPTGAGDGDPDAPARAVIQRRCEPFDRMGALSGVLHSLVRHHLGLPLRARTGPQQGQWPWRRPAWATRSQGCHPPIDAGASAYGRRPVARQGTAPGHAGRRPTW